MYPSQMRLATMQMHSLKLYLPPLLRTARSISSRSILLEVMMNRYLTRFLHRMILILSMSRQMPRFSHTFWYFLLSYSQALKSAVFMALMIQMYSAKSPLLSFGLGQQSLPSRIRQGIKQFRTSFFWPLLFRLIFIKHCSAQSRFSLTRAYLPFWKRKLSMHL